MALVEITRDAANNVLRICNYYSIDGGSKIEKQVSGALSSSAILRVFFENTLARPADLAVKGDDNERTGEK